MVTKKDTSFSIKQLEDLLEVYLVKKAPKLPDNIKEAIVKFSPWITLLLIVLALPVILAVFGLGSILMPFSFIGGMNRGITYLATILLSGGSLILEAVAIPGLFKRTRQAWNLMFYATLLSGVENIISFNVGGLVIGTGIALYLLFQVKTYYK